MKKYILLFITIVIILGICFVYNTINIEESKKILFKDSGYILCEGQVRYYFNKDESYTKSYDGKVVFLDTEGKKITIENDNFIHYLNGNIVALQDSVLLDLKKLEIDPIVYYNVSGNKEIKKVSKKYVVKNLDKDIQFEQGIWKISQNKYIILGEDLKIVLNTGTEKNVKNYVEIEYCDNEIVNIYNQDFNFNTISSNSYIVLADGVKLNLGTKIVSLNDENKMTLDNMVINSDDNVTLVDLDEYDEKKNDNKQEENEVEIPENQEDETEIVKKKEINTNYQ